MYLLMLLRPLLRARSERGASSVEYGLLVAGIAALMVAAVFLFGGSVLALFDDSCESLKTVILQAECTP
ncbi:Flp family type IVb pilin [Nocardioides campestrisoli]|uniref:Flp family type IVb pilin n=1 Tax=Nocardioides campestrisoli TaxID=2736757 RepID=UPI001CD6C156|nr:Flp family type IVb pilin [Nocardioides campestrisoli]